MTNRRKLFPFWFPLLFGLISLTNVIGRPSVAAYRTVDVVQLLATGMLFGVALTTIVTFMRGSGSQ